MKKARVAPMMITTHPLKEAEEATNEPFLNDYETPITTTNNNNNIDNSTLFLRGKWAQLGNTVRQMNRVRKRFEEVRENLSTSRGGGGGGDGCRVKITRKLSSQCLLEDLSRSDVTTSYPYNANLERIKDQIGRKKTDWIIRYFIDLSAANNNSSREDNEKSRSVDYTLLKSKLDEGCDINAVDKFGQSILHEVARIWHIDVARFCLAEGADINLPDNYGRTPLHVASAVDYPEMVEFLIEMGANINALTKDEHQTPLHYAAQNDATSSLKVLLNLNANIDAFDYKERTPLQLAAELDRSKAAEILLEEGAPAGVYDDSKLAALVLMIEKMPNVATKALDQFYSTNRANRKQYFYLNFMVPPIEAKTCFAKSPLHMAVECKQYQMLLHPVFQQLIEVKWSSHGMWGALFYGFTNLVMTILWTVRLCLIPIEAKDTYTGDYLFLNASFDGLACFAVLCLLISETREYFKAKRAAENFQQWREEQIQRDLKFAHPRWPEERDYLEREIRQCEDYRSSYFRDHWNLLDWSTQFFMIATIILHLCNMNIQTEATRDWFRIISSATLLSAWLRLLKYARPFRAVGLFVVMLSHVIYDTLRILYLTVHIFVPFAAAFWMMFGIYNVKGYTLANGELFYNIFQIGVVGDYGAEKLEDHAPVSQKFMVGGFIFLGGIVVLNLFIALMSDTFQRVYDNAKATAQMQRAATIVELEEASSVKRQQKLNEWVTRFCSPQVMYYDDDVVEEDTSLLKKMTHQIKERVDRVYDFIVAQPENTVNPEHINLSQNTLKTNEQLSHRDSDVKYLVDSLNELRADFYKSTIQTRAEIAGLGLMLKDLIDEQSGENKKKRKAKKANAKQSPPRLEHEVRKDNVDAIHKEFMVKNPENMETSASRKHQISNEQNRDNNILDNRNNNILDNRNSYKEEKNKDFTPQLRTDNNNTRKSQIQNTCTQKNTDPVPHISTEYGGCGTPENDFYEGYTFRVNSRSSGDGDDRHIKRTWGSIFTQMVDHKQQNEGGIYLAKDDFRSTVSTLLNNQDDVPLNKSFNT